MIMYMELIGMMSVLMRNNMDKVNYETVSIYGNTYCLECGWPIIHVCCNGSFCYFKNAVNFDWWLYCSNKTCSHHDGEGLFQNTLDWICYNKG